jgi:serine protease Do
MRTGFTNRSRAIWAALIVGVGALTGCFIGDSGEAQGQQSAAAPQFADRPSFADVFEQVNPAVVTVSVTMQSVAWQGSGGGNPWAGTPFEDFFSRLPNQGFQMPQPRQGVGSGFIIDPNGYIATNNHVVTDASALTVTLASGEELEATVVGTDPRTDLALIKVESDEPLPALRFGDSDATRVGDWVLAIGNPFGLGGTATAGIVSARGRDIGAGLYDDFLQIDAAINSGNSGGPVFNASGEVIGVNTAIVSPSGGSVGIGFAIPSAQAENVLMDLRDNGTVSRTWLGVAMQQIPVAGDVEGVVVEEVMVGGPAAAAGLMAGDIVTSLDGEAVDSPRTLAHLVGTHDVGEQVAIEVQRNGEARELTVTLGETNDATLQASSGAVRKPQSQPPQRMPQGRQNYNNKR